MKDNQNLPIASLKDKCKLCFSMGEKLKYLTDNLLNLTCILGWSTDRGHSYIYIRSVLAIKLMCRCTSMLLFNYKERKKKLVSAFELI